MKRGDLMGDRMQRVKGKAEELRGSTKRQTGRDTGRRGTEGRGAAEDVEVHLVVDRKGAVVEIDRPQRDERIVHDHHFAV